MNLLTKQEQASGAESQCMLDLVRSVVKGMIQSGSLPSKMSRLNFVLCKLIATFCHVPIITPKNSYCPADNSTLAESFSKTS